MNRKFASSYKCKRFDTSDPTPICSFLGFLVGPARTSESNPLKAHFVYYRKWAFEASRDVGHKCQRWEIMLPLSTWATRSSKFRTWNVYSFSRGPIVLESGWNGLRSFDQLHHGVLTFKLVSDVTIVSSTTWQLLTRSRQEVCHMWRDRILSLRSWSTISNSCSAGWVYASNSFVFISSNVWW